MRPTIHRRARRAVLLLFLAAAPATAQTTCPDLGSVPTAANWESGPVPLGCEGAPGWPAWHLFTPAHRAPAPHAGFRPGNATARPRVLIAWRCTGFLLLPVVPARITAMGYVVDQPEYACGP